MSFADTSQTQFAFVPEATWGTTPSNPSFQKMRITGESLVYDIRNEPSQEIRPDVDISDLIQLGASASGDVQFELSYGSDFDAILEHALRGSFASSRLDAGTARKSLTFEKSFEVGSPDEYFRFTGCRVGQFSLSMPANERITGSLSVMGEGSTVGQSIISGATYTDANTNPVMAAPDVGSISIGGISGTFFLTQIGFQVSNNLRPRNAVGNLNAVDVGYGLRSVTGSLTAFFDGISRGIYEDFVNGTAVALSWQATDGSNTYAFNLPRVKYQTGRVFAGGNNQDVMAEMEFTALYDSSEGTSIYITN